MKKAATPEEPAKPAAPEKPEDSRKRLEQWLQEARDTLARLEAPGAAAGATGIAGAVAVWLAVPIAVPRFEYDALGRRDEETEPPIAARASGPAMSPLPEKLDAHSARPSPRRRNMA